MFESMKLKMEIVTREGDIQFRKFTRTIGIYSQSVHVSMEANEKEKDTAIYLLDTALLEQMGSIDYLLDRCVLELKSNNQINE
jgi:hypothetical protein